MTKNVRIAIVGSYPPPYGGVSTNVMQLAVHLKREGYNIRVFAGTPEQADLANDVYFCSARDKNFSKNLLFKLKEFNPHLIHSHASTLRTSVTLFSKLLGIPLIHQVYGERFPLQYEKFSTFHQWGIKWTSQQARMIIPASYDLADFFLRLGVKESRIRTIPCLLPLEDVDFGEERNISAEIKSNQLVLVTTGYYPFKNTHYGFGLIPNTARKLQEQGIDFVWFLVGQGTDAEINIYRRKLVEANVEDRVTFLGELERPAILELLQRTHIYVRTKYSDSFGIVIAEAHQLGCHCLIGDNNPYFQEGHRIAKYKTGDVDSLTSHLLEMIPQIDPKGTRDLNSQFATEARMNYEHIKQVYNEVLTK